MQTAASIIEAAFDNAITVNIEVSYGEYQLDFGHSRWIASEVGQAVQHGAWHFDGIRRVRGRVGNHALPQDTAHCGQGISEGRLRFCIPACLPWRGALCGAMLVSPKCDEGEQAEQG